MRHQLNRVRAGCIGAERLKAKAQLGKRLPQGLHLLVDPGDSEQNTLKLLLQRFFLSNRRAFSLTGHCLLKTGGMQGGLKLFSFAHVRPRDDVLQITLG